MEITNGLKLKSMLKLGKKMEFVLEAFLEIFSNSEDIIIKIEYCARWQTSQLQGS